METLLKYWALITGFVAVLVTVVKYFNNRAKREERNLILLEEILKANESMDKSIKELMVNFNDMNTEMRLLRNDYENLLESHNHLSDKVENISRGN